ncbi:MULTISPECIES: TonB-dependent receptor [unclassified Achromobacter]|uniref:TonB-dependent receptor n=1 Tax=unclassified Achromobacter TaxID=2626865 RepID=UPI000B515352|nr:MULTISPECIES: TonB-dependent receptor [unclassified Achromobacter]OWT80042.1 TonB-dependent receptor [Achromobacter sp. HZ34]OWT81925.1 TonB-dependent receptor [Achromobacter sp. HZ28]
MSFVSSPKRALSARRAARLSQPARRLGALTPLAFALCCATPAAWAQQAPAAAPAPASASTTVQPVGQANGQTTTDLAPIMITGNPLGSDALSSPSTIVEGKALDLRREGTLGQTLNGLPGVSTTTYGPMVGRPIIRGLDGDRIRIMNNGLGSVDASSLSFDHAVPIDPISAGRIEVIRGPAALLYGGNAVGGVVNVLDDRIPKEPIDGIHGKAQGDWGGANDDRTGAVQVEGGDGKFAIRADAYTRSTHELRIPGYADSGNVRGQNDDGDNGPRDHLPNSDGRVHGGGVGMSWTGDSGYAGLSYSGYDSDYGSVAEDSVRLKMRQERFGASGEIRDLDGFFKSIKADFAYTDYQHKEVDDGETGTIFKNRGYEARIEARHRDLGPVSGSIGLQVSQTQFSALGDEALVPSTDTNNFALFALEEWKVNDRLTLSAGGRLEYTRLDPSAGGNERFLGASKRDFTAGSFALGAIYKLDSRWSLAANAAYTERAPTFYELYANGPHEATGQYLIGDAGLNKERSYSGDLGLRYKNGPNKGSFGVFYTHFRNYITEANTGLFADDDGEIVPAGSDDALSQAVYRAVPADFYGFEADTTMRVLESGGHALDLNLSGDYTQARNSNTGEPLPRIPPLRLGMGFDYSYGPWGAGVSVTKAFAQHRRPDNDTSTAGYYRLDANASYTFKVGQTQWLAYLRGINLTNQEIRYATSILRDVAPEGGRAVMVGMRASF